MHALRRGDQWHCKVKSASKNPASLKTRPGLEGRSVFSCIFKAPASWEQIWRWEDCSQCDRRVLWCIESQWDNQKRKSDHRGRSVCQYRPQAWANLALVGLYSGPLRGVRMGRSRTAEHIQTSPSRRKKFEVRRLRNAPTLHFRGMNQFLVTIRSLRVGLKATTHSRNLSPLHNCNSAPSF